MYKRTALVFRLICTEVHSFLGPFACSLVVLEISPRINDKMPGSLNFVCFAAHRTIGS